MKVSLVVEIPGLNNRLKEAREELGVSAMALAATTQMTPANVYRIENNEIKVLPFDTLVRLVEALNIPLEKALPQFRLQPLKGIEAIGSKKPAKIYMDPHLMELIKSNAD